MNLTPGNGAQALVALKRRAWLPRTLSQRDSTKLQLQVLEPTNLSAHERPRVPLVIQKLYRREPARRRALKRSNKMQPPPGKPAKVDKMKMTQMKDRKRKRNQKRRIRERNQTKRTILNRSRSREETKEGYTDKENNAQEEAGTQTCWYWICQR